MFSPLYLKQQRIPESQPIFFRRIRCRPAFLRRSAVFTIRPHPKSLPREGLIACDQSLQLLIFNFRKQPPADFQTHAQQPPRFAGRHRAAEHERRRPFGDLQHEGLRQPAVDFGPQPLAHPDVVAQPPKISPGEFRRRNDVHITAPGTYQIVSPPSRRRSKKSFSSPPINSPFTRPSVGSNPP